MASNGREGRAKAILEDLDQLRRLITEIFPAQRVDSRQAGRLLPLQEREIDASVSADGRGRARGVGRDVPPRPRSGTSCFCGATDLRKRRGRWRSASTCIFSEATTRRTTRFGSVTASRVSTAIRKSRANERVSAVLPSFTVGAMNLRLYDAVDYSRFGRHRTSVRAKLGISALLTTGCGRISNSKRSKHPSVSTTRRSRARFSELARRTRCSSAGRRICESGSPSNARQRSGSGARQIEQRVAIAANPHALALLSGVSPGQRLVENLLANLHDVCVSITASRHEHCSQTA